MTFILLEDQNRTAYWNFVLYGICREFVANRSIVGRHSRLVVATRVLVWRILRPKTWRKGNQHLDCCNKEKPIYCWTASHSAGSDRPGSREQWNTTKFNMRLIIIVSLLLLLLFGFRRCEKLRTTSGNGEVKRSPVCLSPVDLQLLKQESNPLVQLWQGPHEN